MDEAGRAQREPMPGGGQENPTNPTPGQKVRVYLIGLGLSSPGRLIPSDRPLGGGPRSPTGPDQKPGLVCGVSAEDPAETTTDFPDDRRTLWTAGPWLCAMVRTAANRRLRGERIEVLPAAVRAEGQPGAHGEAVEGLDPVSVSRLAAADRESGPGPHRSANLANVSNLGLAYERRKQVFFQPSWGRASVAMPYRLETFVGSYRPFTCCNKSNTNLENSAE